MRPQPSPRRSRRGHTLIELVTASVSSAILLAGLGSVVLIASQVANTPMASNQRLEASEGLHEFANDVRFATFIVERSLDPDEFPQVLDFVVADRTNDGTAERIRYEWSGVEGEPLFKTVNGGTRVAVVDEVQDFEVTCVTTEATTALSTTIESSEGQLLGTNLGTSPNTGITAVYWLTRRIDPNQFPLTLGSVDRSTATAWNATRVRFYARSVISPNAGTVYLQLRSTGSPGDWPTSEVLGQAVIPEVQLPASPGWYNADFSGSARGLVLHRKYALVWEGDRNVEGNHAQLVTINSGNNVAYSVPVPEGDVNSVGGTWKTDTPMEIYFQLYGTYSQPGPDFNLTRTNATRVDVKLRSGKELEVGAPEHSRIDASVPLLNRPELLSAYWRTDFDRDPTKDDITRDGTLDWVTASGGAFSGAMGGIWNASGAIESRPKSNFTTVTTVEARCHNTGTGGKGAVLRIQADRQGGTHAPLEVRVQRQADATQTLSLYGKSNDATDVLLLQRKNLSSDFVRLRLTIVPSHNLVNLSINGFDEGTYTYPTYAPTNDNRFLTAFADTSTAEFDYVEIRVAEQQLP
jgi:hypothetical protein